MAGLHAVVVPLLLALSHGLSVSHAADRSSVGTIAPTADNVPEWQQLLAILQGLGGRAAQRDKNGLVIAPDEKEHLMFTQEVARKGLADEKMHLFLEPDARDLALFSDDAFLKVLEYYAAEKGEALKTVFSLEDSDVGFKDDGVGGILSVAKMLVGILQGEVENMKISNVDENGCGSSGWRDLLYRKSGTFDNRYIVFIGYPTAGPLKRRFELTVDKPGFLDVPRLVPHWAWEAFIVLVRRSKGFIPYQKDAGARTSQIEDLKSKGQWL